MGRPPAPVHGGHQEKLLGSSPGTGDQVTMSENKGTKTKLADRIRKHAEAHPNDKRPQEIVAKLDAIRAELLKE